MEKINIVVTGCSKGIGYELVKYFCQNIRGTVIGISRNLDGLILLKDEVQKLNSQANLKLINFDLLNFNQYETDLLSQFKEIDILVNNAGVLLNKNFEEIHEHEINTVFDTNFKIPFFLIQKMLKKMNKNSHIVNISSMGGYQGSMKFAGLSVYSASKAALCSLTEVLAVELKERKISINALCLGAVETDMFKKAFPDYQAPVKANEIAEFIGNFAINGHRFFNGKVIPVALTNP